jgi:hypothetical protein
MGYKISKNIPYQILFAACVGVTYLHLYELTFALWIFTILVTIRKRYSMTLLRYLIIFSSVVVIAGISAFFYDNELKDSIRDFTYLVKPILGLLVGYQLCRNLNIKPFETIIYTGVFIALIHLGIVFYHIGYYKITNIHVLRMYGGYFSDFEIYSLIILLFYKQFGLEFKRKTFLILCCILGLSAFFYMARINFIQFAILYIAMKGYFTLTKKSITVFLAIFTIMGAGYAYIYNMNLSRNGRGLEALLFKIRNAPIEPFKTKVNKDDWQDFNDNYRSFENITTFNQVSREGTSAVLFGKGMGATMDIGRRMPTNEGTFVRHQPILHNGYMTVFLKAGLVGVVIMSVFIYLLIRQGRADRHDVQQINRLMVGTGVFLILASWVMLGLYLKLDNKAIIIGFLLCYKEMLNKQSLSPSDA